MLTPSRSFRPHPYSLFGVAAALCLATAAGAAPQQIHQHGVSQLDVVVQNHGLQISLQGPAHNFVGFEHAPQTASEEERLARARTQLRASDALFALPAEAGCALQEFQTDDDMGEEHDSPTAHVDHGRASHPRAEREHHPDHHSAHGHDHAHDHDHQHVDWRAEYTYQCAAPQHLTEIIVQLWEHYPDTSEIRYQRVSDAGQSGGMLRPDNRRIGMR